MGMAKEAHTILVVANNQKGLVQTLQIMAEAFVADQKYDEAVTYVKQLQVALRERGDKRGEQQTLSWLATETQQTIEGRRSRGSASFAVSEPGKFATIGTASGNSARPGACACPKQGQGVAACRASFESCADRWGQAARGLCTICLWSIRCGIHAVEGSRKSKSRCVGTLPRVWRPVWGSGRN